MSVDAENETVSLDAALMKRYVPVKVADLGMQVLGGMGYTDSSCISHIWVDTRGGQFAAGTDEVMNLLMGREIVKAYR